MAIRRASGKAYRGRLRQRQPHGIPIENVRTTVSATNAVYSAEFLEPFAFRRVLILQDPTDTSLCWGITNPKNPRGYECAAYMIENNRYFAYTGTLDSSGNRSWSWRVLDDNLAPVVNKYTYQWTVPLTDASKPKPLRGKIVVQGQGYGTYQNVFPVATP